MKPSISKSDNPEIQSPRMYQPTSPVGRQYIFGYTKCISNTHSALLDLFSDISIQHENKIYPVPIVFGTWEKAVMYAFGEQFAANPDRKEEGLVDRIKLPIIALTPKDINFSPDRYIFHEARRKSVFNQEKRPYDVIFRNSKGIPVDISCSLTLWAKYYEHLMQMVEQVMVKFSPISYIKVESIPWETPVKMTGSASNISDELEDRGHRILKYNFEFVCESHILQPIKRDKTVLAIKKKFVINDEQNNSSEIDTFTESVKENDSPENF